MLSTVGTRSAQLAEVRDATRVELALFLDLDLERYDVDRGARPCCRFRIAWKMVPVPQVEEVVGLRDRRSATSTEFCRSGSRR
jgi:hypothetical protein